MENSPIENQINSTSPPIPIGNNNQCQADVPNFTIGLERLAELVEANDIQYLQQSGGIHEIAAALETRIDAGISGDVRDLTRRHKAFGSSLNFEDQPSFVAKGFYQLLLEAFKDSTIILLLCCATLSLVIGIKRNGLEEGFRDGAIIFLAIFIVVNFGITCRFFKARRMRKLSRDKKKIGVLRDGKIKHISPSEVVVGDILCLSTCDRVPCDGLLINGGDSFKLDDDDDDSDSDYYKHRSVFTDAKVVRGGGRMLVTSVGKNTQKSKLMRSVIGCRHQNKESKLQIAIDKMNSRLEKIWLSLTLLVLVVQVLRCFVWRSLCDENHDPDPKGVKKAVEEVMNEATKLMTKQGIRVNRLVAMLCILLFSIRDGMPLGIFLSLAYAAKKMVSYKAKARKLPACATIGLVTTICTGKTSDLTLQHSEMAELWIGLDIIKEVPRGIIDHEVLNILREGVGLNVSGPAEFALLLWAQQVLSVDMEELNKSRKIIHTEAFDLKKDRSGLSLRRNGEAANVVHVHWKGAPDKVLSICSHYYDADGTRQTLDDQKRAVFNTIMERFATTDSPECFAFAHKQVIIHEEEEEEEEALKPIEHGLTLLGMVSLKNPYAPEVRQAVKGCRESGVEIKLVVGDDVNTARFMGINSGILRPEEEDNTKGGTVIEAAEFRHSSEEDQLNMTDHIIVMANSSPSDKLLLLQRLKQKGKTVAVTGICTRDSPSLKEADVGLSVGNNAAESAKESSDIIVLDQNFATISAILRFGRCVCNNLQKFVQLQLTLNISAFTINFIVVLSYGGADPIGPFQLLWVNLIMDVFGALALAEPQSSQIRPERAHNISKTLWRNIVVQILYQVMVLLTLYFKGKGFLHSDQRVLNAMIFNCYVFCQVFVLIKMLKHKNCWFLLVGAIVILQVGMMEIMGVLISRTERLDLKQWCFCIGIAALSLLPGWFAKWVSLNTLY